MRCWCKTLFGTKRSQQPERREAKPREKKTLAQRQHENQSNRVIALYSMCLTQLQKGVFIAQKLNYSPAKIPLLPPNRQHFGIFPGHNRNVTTPDTY